MQIAIAVTLVIGTAGCSPEPVSSAAAPIIEDMASPAGLGSAEPNLAVASEGRLYLSWLEPMDSGYALRFATHTGNRWSSPRTIRAGRDFFVNWADFPSIEVLDDRRLAVHWLQRTGGSTYAYHVRIAQSSDGGLTWSEPIAPHRDTSPQEHGFVAMWPDDSGKLGAVWLDGRKFAKEGHDMANEMMLASTTIAPDGTRGVEARLDERTCDCCQNAAAVTSEGPIVAYRNRSNDEIRDIYVTRRVRGTWTTGRAVHDDNWKIAACPVNGPAIAARGSSVALAWFTAANDSARVKLAFSTDAGASFGAPIRIDEGNPAGRVDAVLLPDSTAFVTWIERIGGDTAAVRGRRVGRDGTVGPSMTLAASSSARASGFPKIVVRGEELVFAWTVPGKPSAVRVARTSIERLP